mmetsp:Transcript_12728/g.32643  ORF Transcript_12728/g.32643 Transcript_12728/m.32643 type:complete len:210 (+) Transcript_12728:1233-1862(+)
MVHPGLRDGQRCGAQAVRLGVVAAKHHRLHPRSAAPLLRLRLDDDVAGRAANLRRELGGAAEAVAAVLLHVPHQLAVAHLEDERVHKASLAVQRAVAARHGRGPLEHHLGQPDERLPVRRLPAHRVKARRDLRRGRRCEEALPAAAEDGGVVAGRQEGAAFVAVDRAARADDRRGEQQQQQRGRRGPAAGGSHSWVRDYTRPSEYGYLC